jgi:hypothetical protein
MDKIKLPAIRNRKGDLYDANGILINPSPALTPIDDNHFWCVVCEDVRPVMPGVIASVTLGGWQCLRHIEKLPKKVVEIDLAELLNSPLVLTGDGWTMAKSSSETTVP